MAAPSAPLATRSIGIDASRANVAERTGTEWYAFHVIEGLKRLVPPDVRVFLYTREPLRDDLKDLPPNWENRVLSWPPRRLWTQLRLSWEMLVRPPDLLFVPVHVVPIILPKRSVTTLHDVAFVTQPAAYGLFERWYQQYAVWAASRHATAILTISEFSKSEIIKYFGTPAGKIFTTPLGYDPRTFFRPTDPAETSRRLRALGIVRPYFFYVGRVEWKKNIATLLRAFKSFKEKAGPADNTLLVLAGKLGYGSEEALRPLNEDEKLRRDVLMPGYVSHEDIRHLYAGALAFVFPSWYEGFGLPLIEAMACGTPVVAARSSCLPEVAGDAAIFADPANAEDLAHTLGRVANEPSLRADLVAKGLVRAPQYSWPKTAEMTWEVLKRNLN